MTNKTLIQLIVAAALAGVALYSGGIIAILIAVALILMLLNILQILPAGLKPAGWMSVVALAVIVISGMSSYVPTTAPPNTAAPTASVFGDVGIQDVSTTNEVQSSSPTLSAIMRLNTKDVNGTAVNTGSVFALRNNEVSRYQFMKDWYNGNMGAYNQYSMTCTTGACSITGYNAAIGDKITFVGGRDNSPAVAENVSFVKTVNVTGITAGSTPEYMTTDSNQVLTQYPTFLFYDATETARTIYTEVEAAAIQKSLAFSVFPTNIGEQAIDTYLWVELPESYGAMITNVKLVGPAGTIINYGQPYEVPSADNMYKAVPALTTSTNVMRLIGKLPEDAIHMSTVDQGKQDVTITYDHPAANTSVLFKMTSNTNALTSAGGHIDTPATTLNLSVRTSGTDAWT